MYTLMMGGASLETEEQEDNFDFLDAIVHNTLYTREGTNPRHRARYLNRNRNQNPKAALKTKGKEAKRRTEVEASCPVLGPLES